MKKLFLLLVAAAALSALNGCHKDKGDGRTSYTFVNKVVPLDGLNINAWVYEYDEEDNRIDSNYIASPAFGKDYRFFPNPQCHHLKAKVFSTEKDRWSPHVFGLKEGQDVRVEVTLSTDYAFKEPPYTGDLYYGNEK